jgi:glyoxylase-like metal-dependent hydrolase (beta-lactamase superfamily II)
MSTADFPKIHRFAGRFMQLPKDHVNAFIVELPRAVVVVDATLALSSAQELRRKAESFGKPIAAVLLTHGHPDHYTGLVAFPDVPRVASQGCVDFAREEDHVKAPTATALLGDDYPKTRLFPNEIVKDGDTREYDGVTFTFRHTGPAESPSDGMWIVQQGATQHVLLGDTVAPHCHCFFRDGCVPEWNAALDRLDREFDANVRFYPGHGEAPVGKEAIAWQRGYNHAFLQAVAALPNPQGPVTEQDQAQVLAAMQRYLPGDTLLFLLGYELNESIRLLRTKQAT